MDNMVDIKPLLKDINDIREEYNEWKKNEDNFNIFTILRKESDEVYLHSRFLSALLDPNGQHRLGTTNLNLFLHEVNSKFKYDPNYLEVIPNNKNRAEYKNIDILFIDKRSKQAVIVENKIYHKDTNHETEGQLEKYYGSLIKEGIPKDNIEVYYLTLDGHEPSEDSVNLSGNYSELKDKVKCISYSNEIQRWLKKILRFKTLKPKSYFTVQQYLDLICKMTNSDYDKQKIEKIVSNILKNEGDNNLRNLQFLIFNAKHLIHYGVISFYNEFRRDFADKFRGYSVLEGFDKKLNNIIYNNKKDNLDIIIQNEGNNLQFRITFHCVYGLIVGIYKDDREICKIESLDEKITMLKGKEINYNSKNDYWHIYKKIDNNIKITGISDISEVPVFFLSKTERRNLINRLLKVIEQFIKDIC